MRISPELISLLSLIDDADTTVRTAVENKLIEIGEELFDEMENLYPELNDKIDKDFYFNYLSNLRLNYTLKKLKGYLSNPDPLLMDGLLQQRDLRSFPHRSSQLENGVEQRIFLFTAPFFCIFPPFFFQA